MEVKDKGTKQSYGKTKEVSMNTFCGPDVAHGKTKRHKFTNGQGTFETKNTYKKA